MKRSDIFKIILSEASGRPLDEVDDLLEIFTRRQPLPGLDVELADQDAEQLLTDLRKELPGIYNWLVQGGLMANPGGTQGTA